MASCEIQTTTTGEDTVACVLKPDNTESNNCSNNTLPLLFKELEGIFKDRDVHSLTEDEKTKVRELMANYASTAGADPTASDWTKYVYFNDIHYTRNLVAKCKQFELIVLCWKRTQASRIHSHSGSHCWMSVLSGVMEEDLYKLINPNMQISEVQFPGPCPDLERLGQSKHSVGDVTYINDGLGLHRVKANDDIDGITLHLYSPPITASRIFEPTSNSTIERKPGYYSKYGKKV